MPNRTPDQIQKISDAVAIREVHKKRVDILREKGVPIGPTCPGCGGDKYRYSIMCRKCRSKVRGEYINPSKAPTRVPTEEEIAYVAGFYEGEGTVGCYGKDSSFSVKLYQMKSNWPLVRVKPYVGGYLYIIGDGCWVLELNGRLGINFIEMVWKHLSPDRQQQAQRALDVLQARIDARGDVYSA